MRPPVLPIPPVIGITLDNAENSAASGRYEVGTGYSAAVARAGGLPVMLPHELSRVAEYVALCNGLILTGGVDPDTAALPADWPGHGPVHPKARVMDAGRQGFELGLLAEWESVKPQGALLGVCLGMQLLCLSRGGVLNQFLPDTHPAEVVERHRKNMHALVWVKDTHARRAWALDENANQSTELIHSNHQQAIEHPGTLRVIATAEDGIIEAVDDPNPRKPFCVGVQWHPERSASAVNDALFEAFIAAASR